MTRDKYIFIGATAFLVTLFAVGAFWYNKDEAKKLESKASLNTDVLIRDYNPRLGPDNAKVTIVEFLDPECEACGAMYPVVKQVMKEFEGKTRLIVRYMPFHKNSAQAVSVIEAARKQGKYWEALELVFQKQPEWANHQAPRPELLNDYVKSLGIDMETFERSVKDPEHQSKLQQDQTDGRTLGVSGTPSFFVNGKPLYRIGYSELRMAVQEALGK